MFPPPWGYVLVFQGLSILKCIQFKASWWRLKQCFLMFAICLPLFLEDYLLVDSYIFRVFVKSTSLFRATRKVVVVLKIWGSSRTFWGRNIGTDPKELVGGNTYVFNGKNGTR